MRMWKLLVAAIVAPGFTPIMPLGIDGDWCKRERRVGTADHVEQAVLEHHLGAEAALLTGLEHEQHAPRELAASITQQPSGRGQHRRVGVVAARVHHAFDGRREVEARVLGHRQGVHVAAQQHGWPGLVAFEHADERRAARALRQTDRQVGQLVGHALLRQRQLQRQFGMRVQLTPQRDRPLLERLRFFHQCRHHRIMPGFVTCADARLLLRRLHAADPSRRVGRRERHDRRQRRARSRRQRLVRLRAAQRVRDDHDR